MIIFSYLQIPQLGGRPRLPKRNLCHLTCDKCTTEFDLRYDQIWEREKKLNGLHYCESCLRHHNATNRSDETIAKLSAALTGKSKSAEHRKNIGLAISGENHPQYGKHEWRGKNENYNKHLENWKGKTNQEIYGVEKAAEISKKLSAKCSGSNNPMYGKPSPIGSGNGWSGWHLGIYFRSLLELAFKIQHPTAISAENIISIKYLNIDNVERTYHPDYLLDDKIIEIKPKKLLNTASNISKFQAARKEFGDKFTVMTEDDIMILDSVKIKDLVDTGTIKFIDRYQEKYEAKYGKSSNKILS